MACYVADLSQFVVKSSAMTIVLLIIISSRLLARRYRYLENFNLTFFRIRCSPVPCHVHLSINFLQFLRIVIHSQYGLFTRYI